jgi:hypothetical protein
MLPMQRYEQNKKLNESGVDGYLLVPRVVRIGDPLQDASLSVQSSQNTLYSAQATNLLTLCVFSPEQMPFSGQTP